MCVVLRLTEAAVEFVWVGGWVDGGVYAKSFSCPVLRLCYVVLLLGL